MAAAVARNKGNLFTGIFPALKAYYALRGGNLLFTDIVEDTWVIYACATNDGNFHNDHPAYLLFKPQIAHNSSIVLST